MSKLIQIMQWLIVFSLLSSSQLMTQDLDKDSEGDVRLPLNNYNQLVENGKQTDVNAPASYAIGQSNMVVQIEEVQDRTTATINLTTSLKTFEDQWSLIPLLPVGTAVKNISIDGSPVQLVQDKGWLSFSTQKASTSSLSISYSIDAQRSENGYVLAVPMPQSVSTTLEVEFPDTEIDLSIIPSTNLSYQKTINTQKQLTVATANIPTTNSVMISWRVPTQQNYVISRSLYKGELIDDLITFTAEYDVELFTGESVQIELMPNSITLNEITVDNKQATIIDENNHFNVVLQGRGRHTIQSIFQSQVLQEQGPPHVSFPILRIPISQFEIKLPGKKDLTVIADKQQFYKAINQVQEEQTISKVHIPLAQSVQFSWVDAIPKDLEDILRANANVYHTFSAEEGVLYGRTLIDYEITHGETTNLSFSLPEQAQVNRIQSPTSGVSDWNVEQQDNLKTITVFLDRAIKSNYQLHVDYELLLERVKDKPAAIDIPLLKAKDMHRQRGIVALLAGAELTLKPIEENNITRVGENQLPAFFRNQIKQTIAHTFKYTSEDPKLLVNTITPERKQGKYDGLVDTLISLGEVAMRGSSSLEINVKSGTIVDINIEIPKDINILNVTGPSIRNYKNKPEESLLDIEFTQEMTGQFRIEVNYEKILGDKKSELTIPKLNIIGAEVQHGRIAIEALTAVEVKTADQQHLSNLEISELPQQLLLKTTNPILLAFKYVNSKYSLKLSMLRHKEIDVQVAAIEAAHYQTLITNDGLSVTTARFTVKNSRRQFLRLNLPKESEVWSVFVDGNAEKPAVANDTKSNGILIKMLNSANGFPVEVVYATSIDKMGMFGRLRSQLPLPDMVVTNTTWDVYLPKGPSYQEVESNMQTLISGQAIHDSNKSSQSMQEGFNSNTSKPLHIKVPQQGIKYSFKKLYANKSDSAAFFEIKYASEEGDDIGFALSLISVVLIWLGLFLLTRKQKFLQKLGLPILLLGVFGFITAFAYFQANLKPAFSLALLLGLIFVSYFVINNYRQKKIE